jgi:predicted AAA+ superfamily ATPase
MVGTHLDLLGVLARFNPWWTGAPVPETPTWRRAAFGPLRRWSEALPGGRALLICGARQVGKTTLLMQLVQALLDRGVPASNILYATFDHSLLKLASLDEVMQAWREFVPAATGPEFLLLDDIQATPDWQVWVKPVSYTHLTLPTM